MSDRPYLADPDVPDEDLEGVCPNCGAAADEECEVDCDCDECEGIEALAAATGGDPALLRGRDPETLRAIMGDDPEERRRQCRIAAGEEPACRLCGCSESRACPGGCIWAEPDLCSRCYVAIQATARAWSAGGSA